MIYLLCGLPGSGKTTFAKKLELNSAISFSPDDWMIKLYGHHMPREIFDERFNNCVDLILELSRKLAKNQVDIVFDFGFWKKEDRKQMMAYLKKHKLEFEFYYFDVPKEKLWSRLKKRNQNLPEGTFEITKEMLDMFASIFEEPTETEGFLVKRLN